MKKIKFQKNDDWDNQTFFQIYMKDGEKTIKFIGSTERAALHDKGYLSWLARFYYGCELPLAQLLEWDIYYQLSKLLESDENFVEVELEPAECFEKANEWVKADGSGSKMIKILDLTMETPCGYYYGY